MSNRLRAYIDNFRDDFTGMVTLTYPDTFPMDGRVVKQHWHAFVECLRRVGWLDGYSLVWFLEWQSRGAPHIHILITGWLSKELVASSWARITGGNRDSCSRTEAIRDPDAAGAYARKYAVKSEQKEVPAGFINVGRMWGCCGKKLNDAGIPRLPVVDASIEKVSPCLLQHYLKRCKVPARIIETRSGFVVYGSEMEIKQIWRYLLDAVRSAAPNGHLTEGSPRRQLDDSRVTHGKLVNHLLTSSRRYQNA